MGAPQPGSKGSRTGGTRPGTARYLLRLGYDGSEFAGSARQPGLRTVEGEIRAGVIRRDIASASAAASIQMSSRTDRGVHARANAISILSDLEPNALLRAMNGLAPDLWFTRAARVPEGFRPRAATLRWYRYFERPATSVPAAFREASVALTGRIDIRSFSRGTPPGAPSFRDVDSVEPGLASGWLVVDVRARAFAWGMVRKILTALRNVESGRLRTETLRNAALGRGRVALPLAEPERLVLWETVYPIPWEVEQRRLSRDQARRFRSAMLGASSRARILEDLAPTIAHDTPPRRGSAPPRS